MKKITREEAINLFHQQWTDMQKELGDCPAYEDRELYKRRWILATERLPEVGQRVLVTTKDGFTDIRKCIDAGHLAWFYSGTIAWMPFLVEPYKGEQE